MIDPACREALMSMDAVILAGEREGSIPVQGKNKAFLPFEGRPLIACVMEALDRAESISSVTVVGPRDKLESELSGLSARKPLRYVEQGKNIFDNMWRGAASTFPGCGPDAKSEDVREAGAEDKAVIALTCDMPLLLPVEVDHFVSTAPLDRADLVMGVTRHELLAPFEPRGAKPGIKFIYFCVADRIIRHANLFCLRPLRLAHVMETYIPLIYRLRYQRKLKNVISAARATMRFSFTPASLYLFFMLQAASWCHRKGLIRLREFFREPLGLSWIEDHVSGIFHTRFAVHETIGPGSTLDVDDDESFRAFLEMSHEWRKIQLELIEGEKARLDWPG